MLMSRTA